MSSYYYSSGYTKPSGGASKGPYQPYYSYPKPPAFPSSTIYTDPVVSNPNDPGLGTLAGTVYDTTPHQTGQQLGVMQPSKPPIDFSNIDYSNDPILARVRALAEEGMGQANADARANRTRLAIGLGDPDLVDQLKLGADVRKQASENTFGTFQELSRQLDRRNVFDITGQMSDKHNLFYPSARQRALGLSGEQYLRDKSQATNAVQSQLAQISQNLAAAKMQWQSQIIAAEQDAYSRALQQALYAAGAS